jgi:hypothetical protein
MLMRCFILVIVLMFGTASAFAQVSAGQKLLGVFGVWRAYTYKDGDQPVCYMVKTAGFPKIITNKKFARGAAYLMITHRPGENSKDVVNYTAGYNFKPASDVTIHAGKDDFDLFTQKDTAWSRDTKTDHALSAAIRHNSFIKIIGLPAQKVSPVTDTLDMKGAAEAYQAIGKACGYEADAPPAGASTHKNKHK